MAVVDDFLRKVLRSGLVSREQLQSALRTLPTDQRDEVQALAEHLVQEGKLTRFQAHKLLQGVTFGLVLGPYQILTPIGRGGMGTVFLAFDVRAQRHVALKILPPKLARSEERMLARFQREMELSQRVNHPQIARTLEAGVYQNVHYLAMEYIPGQTLYRLVTTTGPMPPPRIAHIFSEVASGLAHAHGQGLIHRDLKPSNIMVTPRDHAKVLDLGLAYSLGEEVEDIEVVGGRGYIVGSIDYMAPEQTRDPTNIDARADLYALGCCLYFALTGAPPFPSGEKRDKVRAHRHEAPEPIRQKNPNIPEGLAALTHRLLAKQPAERFASAGEVIVALAPWRGQASQPLDRQDDSALQRAIQQSIQACTTAEPSVKDSTDDAVIFGIDPAEPSLKADMASWSIFKDIDHNKLHLALFIVVLVWTALLFLCTLATCLYTLTR